MSEATPSTSLRVQLDAATLALVDRVVAERGLDRGEWLARALAKQARDEAAFLDFIQEGVDDLEAGRWITHEDLVAELKAERQARRAA